MFHVWFCHFLTSIVVSQETGKVAWYSHLWEFSTVCCDPHSQRLLHCQWSWSSIFQKFPCFLHDPRNVGNLLSGSPAFSKPNLYIWKFSVHILLKPVLKDFEYNLASVWNEHNGMVVETSRNGYGNRRKKVMSQRLSEEIFSRHVGRERSKCHILLIGSGRWGLRINIGFGHVKCPNWREQFQWSCEDRSRLEWVQNKMGWDEVETVNSTNFWDLV